MGGVVLAGVEEEGEEEWSEVGRYWVGEESEWVYVLAEEEVEDEAAVVGGEQAEEGEVTGCEGAEDGEAEWAAVEEGHECACEGEEEVRADVESTQGV